MFPATLRRHGGHSAFHQLQQRLLHTLTRHVTGDGRVLGLAGDLIHFVDVNDATLCAFHVVLRRLQQLEDDVLHILSHITGLSQRGRIRHRERHVQNPRQRLRQQRFTAPGRTDQQDVGFRQFNIAGFVRMVQTLVVVVHRHRQHAFGRRLTNHIVVQHVANLTWCWHALRRLQPAGLGLFADDIHAQFNAFITDENRWTRNKLAHLVLALSAEAAVKRVLAVTTGRVRHVVPFRPNLAPIRRGLPTFHPA
mmetsp:Transcript_11601/g.14974  ORF Transcript_11601/g.14974 Transcript_11601/m.14974 type:complete len:251 (-) Transcript_11601:224-976(-)